MDVTPVGLDGVFLLRPRRHADDRGYFEEIFNQREFQSSFGRPIAFVQDNLVHTRAIGTVRGLHFQVAPAAQAKLVRVLSGVICDVVVDIRQGSSQYGQHVMVEIDAESGLQLFVPEGFAHGYCTLKPDTLVFYKVNAFFSPDHERSILWNDSSLAIPWPVGAEAVVLSDKDARSPLFSDLPAYFRAGD